MKRILLSNGGWAIVDDEDWLYLVGFNWHTNKTSKYAMCNSPPLHGEYMHRVIAKRVGLDCSYEIDHVNGDRLDNRRCNLRAATRSQNSYNAKRRRDNTSGFRGVCWDKRRSKWQASIKFGGRRLFLGNYDTKEAAAFAYKIASKKYYKAFSNTGE